KIPFGCALLLCILPGCSPSPDQALGTLEWDRVNSRAPASEIIMDIMVEEGTRVEAGDLILIFDNRKIMEQIREQEARLEQATWYLAELEKGPRAQKIAEAEARLKAAEATLENDQEIYNRQKKLYKTDFTSKQQLDITKKNYLNSKEKLREYAEQLDELQEGTRIEQIKQARANVETLTAQLKRLNLQSAEYTIRAPRAGVVDSLPFKKGDRPPSHAVVSTLLAGQHPWARVYVPEPFRSKMKPGQEFSLRIDGQDDYFPVKLRSISSDASFTPYYALTERDRSRLAYVAKLDLVDEKARELTAGTPVQLILERL
ncbi:MAG: HlyD family secretion protein, partial [Desulfocapsaceae bacterium]